jgi:histidyl-tRNA synthetase
LAATVSTKPPSGTRDFLPDDIRRREYVIERIRSVYERYGFEPLETPALENIETLLGKYGEEGNRLIFKILRRGEHEQTGEADLALRYDLTVPLARVVAQYRNELPKFFKRYQIQPVWRADRPARGRFREFYQCDIDTIGSMSPVVEAEQIASVAEVLQTLGFSDFQIQINHRQLLTGLLSVGQIPPVQHETAVVALDKFDKIGEKGVAQELSERGIDADKARGLIEMLREIDTMQQDARAPALANAARLELLGMFLRHTSYGGAVGNLGDILRLTSNTAAADHVRVNPRLARGLSYYTGAIMEITAPNAPGSLAAGGRYDNLVGMFLGRDIPACGFSLGLERIIVVMTERGMFPPTVARGAIDVMVTLWSDETRGDALTLAADLRAAGLRADVYPEADRIGKQLKYAAARSAPLVVVVGEEERARNQVSIKDLNTGDQQTVARGEAPRWITQYLAGMRPS